MNVENKMDTEKMVVKAVKILFAVFLMVISICVLAGKVPEMEYVTKSIENLDESRDRVMTFSGATLTASTAISLLPKDWANPLANSLADMNKYFIFSDIDGTLFDHDANCIPESALDALKKEDYQNHMQLNLCVSTK